MKEIIIYTNNNCPYCKIIKDKFKEKNIEFNNKLTTEFVNEWRDVVGLTGIPTVPTIKVGSEYIVPNRDFGTPEQLINILETFRKSPYSDAQRSLEKLKTLNYSINIAFVKIDQLLRQIETNTKKE